MDEDDLPMPETPSDPGELDDLLGRNLRRATNAVMQHFAEAFDPFQIRPALYAMLMAIQRLPGASGAQLSHYLAAPRSNSVLLLQELEKRGLILRSPSPTDARSHAFRLSEAGEALMPQLHAAHARHVQHFDRRMTAAEKSFLTSLLQRLWKDGDPQAR